MATSTKSSKISIENTLQIRWKNYRGFKDTGLINLKPITLLIGPNNSGKSSILSPLLLLAQTMHSIDGNANLITNGSFIDVGNYRDIANDHDVSKDIFFGLRFLSGKLPEPQPVGAYPPGGLDLTFTSDSKPNSISLKSFATFDLLDRPYFSMERNPSGEYNLTGAININKMKANEKEAIKKTTPMNFLFSPNEVLFNLESKNNKKFTPSTNFEFSKDFSHFLRAAGFSYSSARSLLDEISYIGPLREKLHRYYRVSIEEPETVGARGENVANLLRKNLSRLEGDINKWINEFEFGEKITCDDLGDDFFQLHFIKNGKKINVADAGFGASQVLPLIVQALVSQNESLTIAEQPEIHLNPRLQCSLADLFVQMANNNHRILIETHSEHLITRMRRLIASKQIDSSEVGLFFVEQNSESSSIREIQIQQNGGIVSSEWPKGFFNDALRESLALASAQSNLKVK